MTITENIAQKYSGPAQQMLYRKYGDPTADGWENNNIVGWAVREQFPWFPSDIISVHHNFGAKLCAAFEELQQRGLHKEIKTFDGAFDIRHVRGSNTALSVHAWGAAIDMNAKDNQIGTSGTWSCSFLEIMLLNGVFCGQNWVGRKDPMHFAMVNG